MTTIGHFSTNEEVVVDSTMEDCDDDGYQGTTIVDVPFGRYENQILEQKYVGLTAHGHESDEDDYEMMGMENTDDNLHCFPFHKMLDPKLGIRREEYALVCESLQFVHGPAPISKQNLFEMGEEYSSMVAACHHKKAYKVVVSVPKCAFPSKSQLDHYEMNMTQAADATNSSTMAALQQQPTTWVGGGERGMMHPTKEHPSEVASRSMASFGKDGKVSYRFFIILYLGTISKIKREFQQSMREMSKIWWLPVEPRNVDQQLTFEVTFTNITSIKLKIPFRLYAQLQVVASTSPGQFTFLCQGRSMPFSLYSHSQQYGFIAPNKCPCCLQPTSKHTNRIIRKNPLHQDVDAAGLATVAAVAATGFKDREGNRKLYICEDLNRFAVYRDHVTAASAALSLTSLKNNPPTRTTPNTTNHHHHQQLQQQQHQSTTSSIVSSTSKSNHHQMRHQQMRHQYYQQVHPPRPTLCSSELRLLFIFPKVVYPGQQIQIAVHGTDQNDSKLFIFMDKEPSVVEFFRIHRDTPGLFTGNAPMRIRNQKNQASSVPLYIRKLGRFESVQKMVNVPMSDVSSFSFQ